MLLYKAKLYSRVVVITLNHYDTVKMSFEYGHRSLISRVNRDVEGADKEGEEPKMR